MANQFRETLIGTELACGAGRGRNGISLVLELLRGVVNTTAPRLSAEDFAVEISFGFAVSLAGVNGLQDRWTEV